MLIIGLTGGIASGKTKISDLFSQLETPIIDTDTISRKTLEPGQSGYLAIVNYFGTHIVQNDSQIDRRKLRQLVFNDIAAKQWLESELHPIYLNKLKIKFHSIIRRSISWLLFHSFLRPILGSSLTVY